MKTKIILTDDEALFRSGIKAILIQEETFEILCETANGSELLHYLDQTGHHPDIVLMDIKMPQLNGIEATKIITQKYPEIKVIALSSYSSEAFVCNMMKIGAACHIPKNASPDEMIHSIHQVMKNGFYYSDLVMRSLAKQTPKSRSALDGIILTRRELQILELTCRQCSSAEIGEQLCISLRTVEGHRNRLIEKTDAKSVVGLAIFAIKNNLFLPGLGELEEPA